MSTVVILVVLFFLATKIFSFLSGRQEWIDAYRHVGRRYHGKKSADMGVSCPTLLSRPTLNLRYRSTHCSVRSRRRGSLFLNHRWVTQVTIVVPWQEFDFQITTGEFNSWGGFSGRHMKRVIFDQPEFQAAFKAASKTPVTTKRQLTEKILRLIDQIRQQSPDQHVHVQTRNRSLTVSVAGRCRDRQRLDDFVRMSLKVYDLLLLGMAEGLSFVAEDQVNLVENVNCPICSETIEFEMVTCVRCQSPHCRDCWEYNGQCATYACQETRYLEGTEKKASSPESKTT